MGCLILTVGLLFPRLAIVLLWLFYDWFEPIFQGWLIPLLGFLFLPYTLLWYTLVERTWGEWGLLQLLLLVVAVMVDFGAFAAPVRARRQRVAIER